MTIVDVLRENPWVFYATVGFVGLCVGSFLNVVIHRLPKMMEAQWRAECAELNGAPLEARPTYNLVTPNSGCPACGTPIRAWQNVPIVSWLLLRGKCAACKASISARYPAVEALTGILSVAVAWRFGFSAETLAGLGFVWALVALTFIDLDTQLLPDDITLPLLWAGLLVNAFRLFVDLRSAVLGAVVGYMLLWSVYWAFRLIAKKEGMGYGDFKLLAALCAWFGWQVLPLVVLVSALSGAIIGSAALALTRRGIDTRIPFGPYLALGGVVALFWGHEAVVRWVGAFPVL
jgi:leader peptidase (prepilin peptidase)/N-methyltransferase